MFQIKTLQFLRAAASAGLLFAVLSGCSKKPTGVRPQTKSQQVSLNPGDTAQATQQAAAMNADYKIASISLPNQSSQGFTVDVELATPGGETLPLTTRHENGYMDSQGVYTDTKRGLQVLVQARCSSDECFKYLLLVTVIRNNQNVFQTAGISYRDDCKFNTASSSSNIGSFLQNLYELESKYNIAPRGDIDTCTN